MKRSLNLFVLSAFLFTSMPFNPTYARTIETDNETIEVPSEAVALSEQLVEENARNQVKEDDKGPSCIKSGVAYSPRMTKKQRKELFVHGRITDCDGNIWNIKVIPGSDKSKQMTIKSWRYAGNKAKQMFQIETYKKAVRHGKYASKASFNFAKSSSKLLKKGIWDYMIVDGVYENLLRDNARVWKNAGVTVSRLRGSFGWLFGAIYAGILKPVTLTGVNVVQAAFHITKGAVVLVGGIAGTAGGIVATVASPVIVPVVEVMTQPLLAVGSILTTGSIIPGIVYVWNGTAWVSTQLSHVPDSETVIGGVRFVRLENPKQPEKPQVEVTTQNFSEVIESGVRHTTMKTQQGELTEKRKEIEKQIAELQKEANNINNRIYSLETEYRSESAVQSMTALLYKIYGANVTVAPEVIEAAKNDETLRELIQKYADENGVSLSEQEIQNALSEIKRNLKAMNIAK